jgi:hypothetical protein
MLLDDLWDLRACMRTGVSPGPDYQIYAIMGTRSSFTQKGRRSASWEGRKLPGIFTGATTIVAPNR